MPKRRSLRRQAVTAAAAASSSATAHRSSIRRRSRRTEEAASASASSSAEFGSPPRRRPRLDDRSPSTPDTPNSPPASEFSQRDGVTSSQIPVAEPKVPERQNRTFEELPEEDREQILRNATKAVLAHGLCEQRKEIKTTLIKEVCANYPGIHLVVLKHVQERLSKIFGFLLVRPPPAELQNKKCSQDTFFLVNKFGTGPDLSSEHMRFVNQGPDAAERGLLMIILSIIFIKGGRVLEDELLQDLIKLQVCEQSQNKQLFESRDNGIDDMERYIRTTFCSGGKGNRYLQRKEDKDKKGQFFYSMGPRAATEIGTNWIAQFLSTITKTKHEDDAAFVKYAESVKMGYQEQPVEEVDAMNATQAC